jgi:hypothetical protein
VLSAVLGLGFVVGMQHAFEADHLAAVSTLLAREGGVGRMSRLGLVWGLGHTLSLVAVTALVLYLPFTLSQQTSQLFEMLVGVMLIALGAHLLWRLMNEWRHPGLGRPVDGLSHDVAARPERSNWVSLGVGLVHGLAGSAALTVLVADRMASPGVGLLYASLFGLGSMVGMALLSVVVALPLRATARTLTSMHQVLQGLIAICSVGFGLWIFKTMAGTAFS